MIYFQQLFTMKKVELMANPQPIQQQTTSINDRLRHRRPEKLSVTQQLPVNEKWMQCKIIGKNISIRSYSAICVFQNKVYIYGGYQILNGLMSDFYCIDLDDSVSKFDWVEVQTKGTNPGPRSKHALFGAKQKIYMVGGLKTDMDSSNQIHCYDPSVNQWSKVQPVGDTLPQLDSFGSVYINQNDQQKIFIVCGYDGQQLNYTNSLYEYNITKNKVSLLFERTDLDQQGIPPPRSGCAAATDGTNIYIFGGKNAECRMNDLWQFNLTDFKYRLRENAGDIPPERNGHSMDFFQGKLYVFGGIHDITWELDDLHIYSLKKNRWTTLQKDSPRKIVKKKVDNSDNDKQKKQKSTTKRRNFLEAESNYLHQKHSALQARRLTRSYFPQQDSSGSPGKMIQEQKKKAFMQRKANLLKNFQISPDEKKELISLEIESQAIKNSLDIIGQPNPHSKANEETLTDFGKSSKSKFLEPLTNNSNLVLGRKPCARDGHCSVLLNESLIIFGGDRHQMSFNDIYKLDFNISSQNEPNS